MPDTPEITPQVTPEVQPSAGFAMDATPQAFGAGVGQALENAGEVATRIHHDAWQAANQTAVLDAQNQRDGFRQGRLYDPDKGIFNQPLGKNAHGAVDQFYQDDSEHAAQVRAGLTNDTQRQMFDRVEVAQRFHMERQLGEYEHRQTLDYQNQVTRASLANATTMAVQNAANPDLVQEQIAKQKALITDNGRFNRLPPEVVDAQVQEAASATHMGVLEQLLSQGQDQSAKQWYDAHKGDLTGRDLTTATKMVDAGSTAGEAMRTADRIVLGKDGDIDSRAAIDERVRQIADPRLRDEVQTRVDRRLAQHERELEDQRAQTFQEAYGLIRDPQNAKGVYDPRVVTLMGKLAPQDQEKLRRIADKPDVVTDQALYQSYVLGMADPKTRDRWLQRDPLLDADKLAPADMSKLIQEKATYLRGGDEAQKQTQGTLTRDEAVKTALRNAGMDPQAEMAKPSNDPGTPNAYFAIDREVRAIEQTTGKKLTPDDITKVGTAILVKRAYQGESWYNANRRPIEFTADQIPAAERQKIVEAANRRRHSPSDQDIVDAYLMNLASQAIRDGR